MAAPRTAVIDAGDTFNRDVYKAFARQCYRKSARTVCTIRKNQRAEKEKHYG